MRGKSKLFWMGVVVLMLSSFAVAQSGTVRHVASPGPMPPVDDLTSGAAANFGGSFVLTFNITVKSNLPSTDVILCNFDATTNDGTSVSNPFGRTIDEHATAVGTRTSSTAAKCSFTMYYNWLLTTQSTDTVDLEYSVTISPPAGAAVPAIQRSSSQGLGSMPVPANGAVTTKTIAVTM